MSQKNGTYAIRFDYDSEKLQLWQISTAYDWLISSSAVGVGSTETYIYFSRGDGGDGTLLPSVSEIRSIGVDTAIICKHTRLVLLFIVAYKMMTSGSLPSH